jgi:hypothetical protein
MTTQQMSIMIEEEVLFFPLLHMSGRRLHSDAGLPVAIE